MKLIPPNPAMSQKSDACMVTNLDYQSQDPHVQTRRARSIDHKPQDPSSPGSCGVTIQTVTPLNPPKVPQKRPGDLVTRDRGADTRGSSPQLEMQSPCTMSSGTKHTLNYLWILATASEKWHFFFPTALSKY